MGQRRVDGRRFGDGGRRRWTMTKRRRRTATKRRRWRGRGEAQEEAGRHGERKEGEDTLLLINESYFIGLRTRPLSPQFWPPYRDHASGHDSLVMSRDWPVTSPRYIRPHLHLHTKTRRNHQQKAQKDSTKTVVMRSIKKSNVEDLYPRMGRNITTRHTICRHIQISYTDTHV